MDIKTIFGVAIKLIGVYFLFGTSIDVLLQSTLSLTQTYPDYTEYENQLKFSAVVNLVFWILMPLFLIFKTDKIINSLDLIKGLGESTSLSLDDSVIMKSGLIFIGGFCIIDHLPTAITLLIMYVREIASGDASNVGDILGGGNTSYRLIREGISLIIGIVILTNYDRLARALMPKAEANL